MSKKISLKQYLMKTGKFEKVADAVNAIKENKVTLNGKIVAIPNYFFNPEKILVRCGDEKIKKVSKLYFLMNKPAGLICQKSEDEKTIYDILKSKVDESHVNSLFAVGRLDKDTEGLLIITNDGKLAETIMHPAHEITKKYFAVLEKNLDKKDAIALEKGIIIELEDEPYKTRPAKIRIVKDKEVYVSITEGKKRQVKRMFESIGNRVVQLKRVSIGGVSLGKLETGEIMQISKEELVQMLEL